MQDVIYVNTAKQVPQIEHWAILETGYYTTQECGVWAPGHGYPSETCNYVTYTAYLVKEKFEEDLKEILTNRRYRTEIRAIHVNPLDIEVETTVKVSLNGVKTTIQ